jgi:hypothetical protein
LIKISSYTSYESFGLPAQIPGYKIRYNENGEVEGIVRIDEVSELFPEGQMLRIYKRR